MALPSRYAVTVSAAVATRPRADCSSMEDRRGNKRPFQPKHSRSRWVNLDSQLEIEIYLHIYNFKNILKLVTFLQIPKFSDLSHK